MDLSEFNDVLASPPRGARLSPAQFGAVRLAALLASPIPSGYFTLTLHDGSRRYFRIRLERGGGLAGQRSLAIDRAPDGSFARPSSREWENIALVRDDGFAVFKRWQRDRCAKWCGVLWELLGGREVVGCGVTVDARCRWSLVKLKSEAARARGLNDAAAREFGLVAVRKRKKKGKQS